MWAVWLTPSIRFSTEWPSGSFVGAERGSYTPWVYSEARPDVVVI